MLNCAHTIPAAYGSREELLDKVLAMSTSRLKEKAQVVSILRYYGVINLT